jgi:integrase
MKTGLLLYRTESNWHQEGLVDLRWEQIDLEHALLHVRRLKNGSPATHPLTGKELRAMRRLQRE